MKQFDGSVLWLLGSGDLTVRNLRTNAEVLGLEPSRLIFADIIPQGEHLARHQHADLFLDTFHYNAHTTASDALWAGLPVVTKLGQQFSSRVCGSLLTAIGLPELITHTAEDYEALIFKLAQAPKLLSSIRDKLQANRKTQPLFDTTRYARNFESGLFQAYDQFFEGKDPVHITIKDSD